MASGKVMKHLTRIVFLPPRSVSHLLAGDNTKPRRLGLGHLLPQPFCLLRSENKSQHLSSLAFMARVQMAGRCSHLSRAADSLPSAEAVVIREGKLVS